MSNSISLKSKGISYSINNSWTNILYSTILLSGAEIANSEWEKKFLIWIAEHDQATIGYGCVGFDFYEISWNKECFDEQKAFVLEIAERALKSRLWSKYYNLADEEILKDFLNKWINLFLNSDETDIKETKDFQWLVKPSKNELSRKCSIHNIYLNKLHEDEKKCCLICNDL